MVIKIIIAVGALLISWAGIVALLWAFQEKLIFHPRPTPTQAIKDLAHLAVEITAADGVILRGWRHPPSSSAPPTDCQTLIYFGGNSEELSGHLTDNVQYYGCEQWYINYRGFGDSDGTPSAKSLRADALAIYDKAVATSGAPVCVIGRSLGAHMAAYVAANRPTHKLIMITPFDSVLNIARARYKIFVAGKLLRHHFDTMAEAANITAPTLFILAEKDYIVPRQHSDNLINFWQAPKTVARLPHTTHNHLLTPLFWQKVQHFMNPDYVTI